MSSYSMGSSSPSAEALQDLLDIQEEIADLEKNPQNASQDWAKIQQDVAKLKDLENGPGLNSAQKQVINDVINFVKDHPDPSKITPSEAGHFIQFLEENLYKFH
jgi:hypothetical protein